jgi:hypothetical protein
MPVVAQGAEQVKLPELARQELDGWHVDDLPEIVPRLISLCPFAISAVTFLSGSIL